MFSTTPTGCNIGPITINDANGNVRSSAAEYALISHGSDGHGAYTKNGVTMSAGSTGGDIVFDPYGNIFVSDFGNNTSNNRVIKYSSGGNYIKQFPCTSGGCGWLTTSPGFGQNVTGGMTISR